MCIADIHECVCIYQCMYLCMHVCRKTWMYICAYSYYIPPCIHTFVCTYAYMNMCTKADGHMCTCKDIIHITHIHKYDTYMDACKYVCVYMLYECLGI